MPSPPYFSPELFRFLSELRRNNHREWFAKNKSRFEAHVRDPLLAFIGDIGPHLRSISPYIVADPSPVGGSMFRIHRDTRFSKDKAPYKTWAAARFRHRAASADVHTPGLYLHIEPGEVFSGVGVWHPSSADQARVRKAIVADPAGWKQATRSRSFRARWELTGESLKRPPRGFDPDHPLVEDLMRKDYIATATFGEDQVCAPGFLERYVETCRRALPFLRFLCEALDLPI